MLMAMIRNNLQRCSSVLKTGFQVRGPLSPGILLFLLSGIAFAQFNSSIEGTVTDATGSVVPDVNIRAVNVQTGVASVTKTSGAGFYSIPALPPGRYRIEASKEGFSTAVQSDIVLESARVQSVPLRLTVGAVPLRLTVGAVATQVNVESTPPVVETSEAHVSEVTTAKEVLASPLMGATYSM